MALPEKEIQKNDLPAMYLDAGKSSQRAQKLFFRWNVVNFIALALAALMSAFKEQIEGSSIVSAILLALGAVLTFWLRKSGLERRWYRSRAVAESVKTLSWRFMMCASPFDYNRPEEEVTRELEGTLHKIARDEREVRPPELNQVTAKMKAVRKWPIANRKNIYLNERVEDQRSWYSEGAEKNGKKGRCSMYWAVATQLIALVAAVVLIYNKHAVDLVGVFAAISASALAWLQLKRFEDLAEAYDTAAKELSTIGSQAPTSPSESELSQFVIDSENAISREHTLWLAKRS